MNRTDPLPESQYGGTQTFFSYCFLSNILKFAISKGQLDTRSGFYSKSFHGQVIDLYPIISKLEENFVPEGEVEVNCKPDFSASFITQSKTALFSAKIKSNC